MTTPPSRGGMLAAAVIMAAPGLLNGFYLPAIATDPRLYWGVELAQWVLLPALCLLALAWLGGAPPSRYGLAAPRDGAAWRRAAAHAALAAVMLWAVYTGASHLAWMLIPVAPASFSYEDLVPTGLMKAVVVAYYAVSAGVVEEITFRGLPLAALGAAARSRGPRAVYVIATAVVFALIHWENGVPELVATFLYGVAAAMLYLRLDSLWPLVIGHTAVDLADFW